MQALLCIDFDGVIRIDDEPADYVYEALEYLSKCYKLVILTARNTEEVRVWLIKNGFPRIPITNIKPPGATAYIDDRGIRFTDWKDICKKF